MLLPTLPAQSSIIRAIWCYGWTQTHRTILRRADEPGMNGFIEVNSTIIPTIVCVASEPEYAAVYHAGKGEVLLRRTFADLNHPQPPTVNYTDNSTAKGIATDTCKMRRSNAINMRYHWTKEQLKNGELTVVCVTRA